MTRLRSLPLVVAIVATLALVAPLAASSPSSAQTAPLERQSKAKVLKKNPLYRTKAMPAVECAPQSQVPLDNAANLLAYYDSVGVCLKKAWKTVFKTKKLKKAGIRFKAPKIKVQDGTTKTPCGTPGALSFYCPANETIYMYDKEITVPWAQYPQAYGRSLTRLVGTHTLAHEYGHHIQQRVGIFPAIGARYQGKVERRAELQASCLGNVFLSAQQAAYPVPADFVNRPDLWRVIEVSNHGSAENQLLWTNAGYSTAKAGACNTFKAPGSLVR